MFRPWTDSRIVSLDGFRAPVDAHKPAVWKAAFAAVAAPPPTDTAFARDGDLLPVNLLWSRGRITGLTDWNSIHRGARAIDVWALPARPGGALLARSGPSGSPLLYESIAGLMV